jgi:glycogen debranching enzyme
LTGRVLRWLLAEVGKVLEKNRQSGVGWNGVEYDFVCPSRVTYPFQWFWDSCFHTIVLSHLDRDRARSEVAGLLANQQPDGSIPHVIFWQREQYEHVIPTYAIAFPSPFLSDQMQPPLLAEAVAAAGGDDTDYLRSVLPSLRRYYDWCHTVRDPDGDGLIAVMQPDETGLDHSPKFDRYLDIESTEHDDFTRAWYRVADRYEEVRRDPAAMFALDVFQVEDVMVNTIYIENQRVLADLCHRVGDSSAAESYRSRADRGFQSLLARCWDEERGLFFDLAGASESWLTTNTVTSLFPLLLPDTPGEVVARLVAHLADGDEYAAKYPVPSVAMDEPSYVPGVVGGSLVWRGPTWLNANWYLARGLSRHGRLEMASQIVDRSIELVRLSGFREYYNPETGEGNGAPDFAWSTIVLDMALRDLDT